MFILAFKLYPEEYKAGTGARARCLLLTCREVEAEGAEESGGRADFGEGGVDCVGGVGFDIQVELIFKRSAVDGAAFDFLEVDAVAGEGFDGRE